MYQKPKTLPPHKPQKVALLLISGFSMVGFSATVEPMHVANRLSGSQVYDWSIVTVDGEMPTSSSNIPIPADCSISHCP